ncbi:unnamed protein product [Adineta ricciae]|uniref:Tudor domain-containing protein n=1 Tax=Adineta ricciae TaxID=249248 RepID=A0A814R7U4_ADIRI|nr:unnamed protein product [Adineta ricciae]CAF1128880.1 unnamed protein product [Adineta ricciae]
MSVKEQLINAGWTVKEELFEGNRQRPDDLRKQLLDSDLRQIGEKALPDLGKQDQTSKPYIVQLNKTRNVTAPKDNESSSGRSHLYRLSITDGHVFQNALILPSLRNFNLDTPPGVKLLLKAKTKIVNGFYILNDQTCEVLGGTVTELVQKWKLAKLMGKHVRILIGEGAPPPWVPFGARNTTATTVDTSQRSMDVAKSQQTTEEDPEFVRQRRAAIDTLLMSQTSKTERFARQDVIRGVNLAKGFELAGQRAPTDRPSSTLSSISNQPVNMAATAAAIKANTRLPEWAKNQIADEPTDDDKRRPQTSRRNLDDDDDRPRRGGFGRNRRGRGRDDDGGEETRPSKDVTLFDFFSSKPNTSTQKAPSSKTQKSDNRSGQEASASNQPRISSAMQKQIFPYETGDQVLARYYEDNEYYPAIIMNIMYDSQRCAVMFEGYDSQNVVSFDDIETYEEGYYDDEGEEEYEQEQVQPPPPQRNNQAQQQPRNQSGYQQNPSNYGYYNQQQQQQQRNNPQGNRPNSSRGYPQQQQQQQYPNRYNNNYYQ